MKDTVQSDEYPCGNKGKEKKEKGKQHRRNVLSISSTPMMCIFVHIKHIILKYVTVTPQYSVMTYFSFLETSTLSSYNADSNMLPFNSFVLLVCMGLISSGGSRIFPRGGREPSRGGVNTPNFPENCMKSKEFGRPGGACVPHAPPRSANDIFTFTCCRHICFGVFSIHTLADIEVLINIL